MTKSWIGGLFIIMCTASTVGAQAELSGWGELRGVRVGGVLFPVTTSIFIAAPQWKRYAQTAHWRTRNPQYQRQGNEMICTGGVAIGGGPAVEFRKVVHDNGDGSAKITIECTALEAMEL